MAGRDRRGDGFRMSGVAAMARRGQRRIFYVLIFMVPISKAVIEIAFPLLLIGWIVEHLPSGWRSSVWRGRGGRWCLIALLAYLGVCALSIVTSSDPSLSLRGFIGKTLEWALYFVIAADVAKEPAVAKRCLLILMASAFAVALDAVIQEMIGRDLFLGHRTVTHYRMTGPYENPADLATYLTVLIPIVFVRWAELPKGHRWFQGVLWVLLFGCLIRTESQGAWLGLSGALGALALLHPPLRKMALVLCLSVVVCGGLYLHTQRRLWQRIQLTDVGKQDRKYMWTSAAHMIKDRPVLGIGLNTFMANYLAYWVGGERQPRYAHNCYLQVAAETGIAGLMTFLFLLGAIIRSWWKALRGGSDHRQATVMMRGLSAGLIAFLIQAAFDTNFYALRQAALFWILAGMATGLALNVRRTASSIR